jgi:hypothetical protein
MIDVELNILSLAFLVVIIALIFTATDTAIKKVRKALLTSDRKPKKRSVGFVVDSVSRSKRIG